MPSASILKNPSRDQRGHVVGAGQAQQQLGGLFRCLLGHGRQYPKGRVVELSGRVSARGRAVAHTARYTGIFVEEPP
jgi:hypothetical protein